MDYFPCFWPLVLCVRGERRYWPELPQSEWRRCGACVLQSCFFHNLQIWGRYYEWPNFDKLKTRCSVMLYLVLSIWFFEYFWSLVLRSCLACLCHFCLRVLGQIHQRLFRHLLVFHFLILDSFCTFLVKICIYL